MPRKMTTTQLELFPDNQSTPATLVRPWLSLPDDTRQALTRLMTRLMMEHAGTADGESGHEA